MQLGHPAAFIDPTWKDILSGLRLDSDPALVSTEGVHFGVRTAREPKRVLIVEDNIDAARTAAYLLNDMGHRAEYAINGYAAVSMARELRPHVVLLDLGLPGLDGFEVCRRIRNDPELAGTRIIVITGYVAEEYRQQSLAAGCDMHLIKPVSPQVLEEILS